MVELDLNQDPAKLFDQVVLVATPFDSIVRKVRHVVLAVGEYVES